MSPEPSIRKVLFYSASNLTNLEERKAFLEHVCRDDPGLRHQLEKLLELQDAADALFELQPEVTPEHDAGPQEGLGTSIGNYRLIERIGEGGCGVVYLAEQQEPVKRKVALKIIRLGMDTENVIARFEAERQALAQMDHPNIARVFDAGATGTGRPYFVMELVDGERITDFCTAAGFDLRQRLELFVQVCQAIQHAHQKGVIHRDIKPSNVLIRRHEGVAAPKVIDFGIAKAATGTPGEHPTFTSFDQFIGTPAYMSPEQASGGMDVDTRSDIYSLGVLLYELIAGRPPFDFKRLTQAGIEETRRILREEEPPPPSLAAGHDKVGDLDWIVMKALAKERARRYDTATGLAADVRRYLNDEPVSARPPSRRYRLGKLVRRNKVAFIAGGIAACGLLSGSGLSTWLFLREKSARQEHARLHDIAEEARRQEAVSRKKAESRAQVAQAAVQLGRGNIAEADRLLGSIPLELTPVSLESADCFRRVADWHVTESRLPLAAARFVSAIHARAKVDDSDNQAISFDLLPASAASCFTGSRTDYERLRNMAIERFGRTRHPQTAEQVMKATLIQPAGDDLLRKLDPLAQLVEYAVTDPESWIANDVYLTAWSNFVLGLKSFRDGDDVKATFWLDRCLASPQNVPARTASANFVLGMIENRAGDRVASRTRIDANREAVERVWTEPLTHSGPYEGFWFDWLIAKMLMDEATHTLE